ncbi:MAG: ATPase [Pseudopedobacter saltans]|uniref:ATPase n=1 Tax=Pseudopedobacter saltans TaxID=151895 RepID=A0A2W5HA74_9SPHI|nr:MAG: ATPase [Pseudopedobacter saltans]
MATKDTFIQTVKDGYTFKGDHVKIGIGILDGNPVPEAEIFLPLKTLNRHGLIAGATGTGKTKTVQMLAEYLSDNSIPVLLMDIKGDLSGIAAEGVANDKIKERYQLLHMDYVPEAFSSEFLTLSNEVGVKLRATVSEFGPILLSKILELNDNQAGLVAMLFKYCDDSQLPLVDLKDFTKVLQYASQEGKDELTKAYGNIATTSIGTILRKVVELQQQGADQFFGEKSFEVDDLMRIDDTGRGIVNILRVTDMQNRPKLFSTFMLQMLDELYSSSPEAGDLDKPKLVIVIDEAHLLFEEASSALLQKIETIIKLIRSKGIGIYFCTQNPQDVPAGILSQLGLKIQHALRAFTAADRKTIKQAAENFPESDFYKTEDLLTQMGIGEAFVTLLNEKGIPTPLVHTLLCSPRSRMDILTSTELKNIVAQSRLVPKYNQAIDPVSAYEILTQKLQQAATANETTATKSSQKAEPGFLDNPFVKSAMRTASTIVTGTIVRSILGALGLGGKKRK